MRKNTCFFTGHTKLPISKIGHIIARLDKEIDDLIQKDVTTFLSGGALGFDQTAASLIVSKKKLDHNIRLEMVLPYRDQDKFWPENSLSLYHNLLDCADNVTFLSEKYTYESIRKRNYYLVDHSAYCICALLNKKSGTAQTVHYAIRKGLYVVNVATPSLNHTRFGDEDKEG